MNNKIFRFFHIGIIGSLVLLFVLTNEKPQGLSGHDAKTAQPAKRFPAAIIKSSRPKSRKNFRKPASRNPASVPDFSKMIEKNTKVKLSAGMILAENIGAMPVQDWKPGMKPFLSQSGAYGFYEKSPGDPSIPTAYNPRTNKFHIISSILQVRGADQSLREKFQKKGLEEYLYLEKVKILFVKSSSGEVVDLYQELRGEGHKVTLEVFKERPQAN